MTIDGKRVIVEQRLTVLAAAQQVGITIPVLCHREGLCPVGGCGICVVEDVVGQRLLPACATLAEPDMQIVTNSQAVCQARRESLELLLSNHPADCEALCERACPAGVPIMQLMALVADGNWDCAIQLARQYPVACGGKAPCEKACRRQRLGGAIAIGALHGQLVALGGGADGGVKQGLSERPHFWSRMQGLSAEDYLALCHEKGERRLLPGSTAITREEAIYEASRCMQCGCRKPTNCRLRELCADNKAQQAVFAGGCSAIGRQRGRNGFRFDASRCVLCGICVKVAEQSGAQIGPAFHGRGFNAYIGPPLGRRWDDIADELLTECVAACPTGAMTKDTYGS